MIDYIPWYVQSKKPVDHQVGVVGDLLSTAALAFSGRLFHPIKQIIVADIAKMPGERVHAIGRYMDLVEKMDRRPYLIAPSHERHRASAVLGVGSSLITPLPARGSRDMQWLRWGVLRREVAGCKEADFSDDHWLRRMTFFGRQRTIDGIENYENRLSATLALMRPGPLVDGIQMGLISITTQVAAEFAAYRWQSGIRSGLSPAAWALSCLPYSVAPPPEEVERWRIAWFDGDRRERNTFPSSAWIGGAGRDADQERLGSIDVMINPQKVHSDTICMSKSKRECFLVNLTLWFEGEIRDYE